jgi:hypothetical protein
MACISGGEDGQNPHSPGCRPYLSRAKRLGTPTLLVVISEESPFSARQFLDILRVIEAEAGDVLGDGPRSQDGAEDLGPIIFPIRPGALS